MKSCAFGDFSAVCPTFNLVHAAVIDDDVSPLDHGFWGPSHYGRLGDVGARWFSLNLR